MIWALFILLGIICGGITYAVCDILSVKSLKGKIKFSSE